MTNLSPSRIDKGSKTGLDFLVIGNLFFLLFLGLADNQVIAALLPDVVNSLKVSVGTAGLLVVVYSLTAALASFISGSLSDRYGRRRFLWMGAAGFALASWVAYLSVTFGGLFLARALTGLAAGAISTCSVAYAGDWFDYSIRGRAIGMISIAYFAAPIIGVPIGAQIAGHFGWRHTFLFFAILAAVVTMTSLTLGKDKVKKEPDPGKLRTMLGVFLSFLRRRDLVAAGIIAFNVSGGLVGFITYLGEYLRKRLGLTTRGIGWVFMLGGLVAVMGAPLGGVLADRWGKRSVSIASNILLAASIAIVPLVSHIIPLLLVFAFTSLGAAFRQGPVTALMTELVPAAQRGSFIAFRNISSQLGIGAAALLGGVLYQRYGYFAVTTLCATMTAIVAILFGTHIVEPAPAPVQS
ncbi:MAG TPA: MFS transporter [Terriglobia bacterium]|nr:MFS transporter [Terriglobia bacterium]